MANATGLKIVGPQVTWDTMPGYEDPVDWLDAFYNAYRERNDNRDLQIDYLGFHWYDYGITEQLDRFQRYGKPFWVTEFANWHRGDGSAEIDSVAKQKDQMTEMVSTLESRHVFRYTWFTDRWSDDTHFTCLLDGVGQLTELGEHYLSLPHGSNGDSSCPDTECASTPGAVSGGGTRGWGRRATVDEEPLAVYLMPLRAKPCTK